MHIAIIAYDGKKELAAQFCTAYAGILRKHDLCATGRTGAFLLGHTDIPVKLYMNGAQGGLQQIGARIKRGEIDMMLFFADPDGNTFNRDAAYLSGLCCRSNIPFAVNSATAEALLLALDRGDLDWRVAMRENSPLSGHSGDILGET
ncbi:MAG: methylglyoxal synthase [Ruminococcaceae bacterium]|nr:methylglyoxal synthase [Oscillospiraceae bacterium]